MKTVVYYFKTTMFIFVFLGLNAFGLAAKVDSAQIENIFAPVITAEAPTNEAVIVKLPDGELKVFYIATTKDKVESISSKDNGLNWAAPEVEFMLPGKAYYAIRAIVDNENELHVVFHISGKGDNGYRGRHYNLWHCKTTGGRKSWTEPKEFFNGYVGSLRGFIELDSGRLLISAATAVPARMAKPESGPDYGWHDITTFYSDDKGQTWKESPDKLKVLQDNTRGLTRYGGVEPHLIQLKDGRVWMLVRTKNGFLYESFSNDGTRWSELKATKFINSDSPAEATRLADGRIVLLFNSCQRWDDLKSYAIGGREVLHALISDDDGKSWHGFREIMKTPENVKTKGDRGTAYASMVETNNGKVLVVSGQGEGQRAILLFDLDWLVEKTYHEDFANGKSDGTSYGSSTTEVIANPENVNEKVLYVHKAAPDVMAGTVFNFPMYRNGSAQIRMKPANGTEKVQISLTDNFSVVNDTLANQNAIFSFDAEIKPNQWNDVLIYWDQDGAVVTVNGKKTELKPQRQMVWGINYLRLICPKDNAACGFYVESIQAEAK